MKYQLFVPAHLFERMTSFCLNEGYKFEFDLNMRTFWFEDEAEKAKVEEKINVTLKSGSDE